MKLSSPDFGHNSFIPREFTCQGSGVRPDLSIEGIPPGAKSLVLIIDDPDAPGGDFVHYVLYDIPVAESITGSSIPGKQGVNTMGRLGYVSPCPPSGVHRYFFKVYALDVILDCSEGLSKKDVESKIAPHTLDKAELIGLYRKE